MLQISKKHFVKFYFYKKKYCCADCTGWIVTTVTWLLRVWMLEKSIIFWPQCGIGEGDCDNDTDCSGNLICGSKNCGANFHQLADCCKEPNIPNITPEFSLSESGKLWLIMTKKGNNMIVYLTRAITNRGLYTFSHFFEVHLCTVTFGLIYG